MADNSTLNAAQLQHIQNEATKALQLAIDRMQLRKWSVEQAVTITSEFIKSDGRNPAYQMDEKGHIERLSPFSDPMALATAIYDFVAQSAAVKVDINPDKPF